MMIPLGRPDIREEDIDRVVEVLRSGWISTGRIAAEFERAFAERVGASGAVAVASGTVGMYAVLASLDLRDGDEIITPSLTWVSTVNVITRLRATPVFADVDRQTLLLRPEDVEPLLSPRTRAIIPVHFAGAPVDLAAFRPLAAHHGVRLIEDAAHAAGTAYGAAPVGGTGTAIFSFHALKNLSTGEGGMVCSDDGNLLERVRRFKFHGLDADAYDRQTQGRSPLAEVIEPGLKFNLPDMNAVLGLSALPRLDAVSAGRAALARRYLTRLSGVPGILPLRQPEYPFHHAWSLFVVRVEPEVHGVTRDELIEGLKKEGIGTGIHFHPVHLHQWYRDHHPGVRLPGTEWNGPRLCSLPLYPAMTAADVDRVVDAIFRVVSGAVV